MKSYNSAHVIYILTGALSGEGRQPSLYKVQAFTLYQLTETVLKENISIQKHGLKFVSVSWVMVK